MAAKDIEKFKYICPTNRDGKDGTTGCFREACTLCNCAPFGKMELEPGKVITEEPQELTCPFTGVALELKDAWIESPPATIILGFRMNENQIKADRKKRSDTDFKKNVFDTLPDSDKRALARGNPELEKRLPKIGRRR